MTLQEEHVSCVRRKVVLELSGWGGSIRMSASISRAASFHFCCGDAADEEVNLILTGFVISVSEKRCDEEGERGFA